MQSIITWLRGSVLVRSFRRLPDITKHPYATATTPDQLISACFIQSIAKDFSKWRYRSLTLSEFVPRNDSRQPFGFSEREYWKVLENKEKGDLKLQFFKDYSDNPSEFSVKGVPLNHEEGLRIFNAYTRLSVQHERLERIAAAKKREMEDNEKKWNLAESLLGMKRDEKGALVPIKTAE